MLKILLYALRTRYTYWKKAYTDDQLQKSERKEMQEMLEYYNSYAPKWWFDEQNLLELHKKEAARKTEYNKGQKVTPQRAKEVEETKQPDKTEKETGRLGIPICTKESCECLGKRPMRDVRRK